MWLIVSAISGAAAVFLGAFGAHGLASRVPPEKVASWNTAASYHLLHSVVLIALALYAKSTGRSVTIPASLLCAGIVLFSGSIYGLVLGAPRWLGPVTPLGGLAFAAGWLALLTLLK